jgi:hypothetical protein
MGRRSLWVSMTFLAGLSGCSGSSDGELTGASDGGSPDTAALDATIDAKPDRRPVDAAYDARRGVNASVGLFVSRSNGAVALSRQCVNIGVAQFCSEFPDSTGGVQSSELTLSGSLSCSASGGGG